MASKMVSLKIHMSQPLKDSETLKFTEFSSKYTVIAKSQRARNKKKKQLHRSIVASLPTNVDMASMVERLESQISIVDDSESLKHTEDAHGQPAKEKKFITLPGVTAFHVKPQRAEYVVRVLLKSHNRPLPEDPGIVCTLGDDTEERWAVDDVKRRYMCALDNERRSSYMYNTSRHRCRRDAVWDGRDALLIESKRGVVEDMVSQENYDEKSLKEDSAKKAFTDSLWALVIEGGKKRYQTYMVAKSIATLTVLACAVADWKWLEEQVSLQKYKEIRHSVFRSFAKYILSVFCMEDFGRVCNGKTVFDEVKLLYSNLFIIKPECNPVIAVAEARLGLEKYSVLTEDDVADTLWQHQVLSKFPVTPMFFNFLPFEWEDRVSPDHIKTVMGVIQKYTPLKEDCKMQLTLEMSQAKCYHVLDTLYLEAWKGSKILELFGHPAGKCLEFSDFLEAIHIGLTGLTFMKQTMLEHSQRAVVFPLRCGAFGTCTDEVLEVIKIANLERLMHDHRFISLRHLLFGLLHSRIGVSVKRIMCDRGLNYVDEEPSEVPMYYIYRISQDVASFFGDEEMGVEHLFLAILFEKLKSRDMGTSLPDNKEWDAELLQYLKKSENKCDVKSWRDSFIWSEIVDEKYVVGDRLHCSNFYVLEQLNEKFKSGFKLPAIRVKEN